MKTGNFNYLNFTIHYIFSKKYMDMENYYEYSISGLNNEDLTLKVSQQDRDSIEKGIEKICIES